MISFTYSPSSHTHTCTHCLPAPSGLSSAASGVYPISDAECTSPEPSLPLSWVEQHPQAPRGSPLPGPHPFPMPRDTGEKEQVGTEKPGQTCHQDCGWNDPRGPAQAPAGSGDWGVGMSLGVGLTFQRWSLEATQSIPPCFQERLPTGAVRFGPVRGNRLQAKWGAGRREQA